MNNALAYEVLAQIEKHPEKWEQLCWIDVNECGTTACFFGWAVMLSGYTVRRTKDEYEYIIVDKEGFDTRLTFFTCGIKQLDIPDSLAIYLYSAINSLRMLRETVNLFANDPDVTCEKLDELQARVREEEYIH